MWLKDKCRGASTTLGVEVLHHRAPPRTVATYAAAPTTPWKPKRQAKFLLLGDHQAALPPRPIADVGGCGGPLVRLLVNARESAVGGTNLAVGFWINYLFN